VSPGCCPKRGCLVTYTVPALLAELAIQGIKLALEGDMISVVGGPSALLRDEIRRQKPALLHHLRRERALELAGFIDGEASYEERIAKMPEYEDLCRRLEAEEGHALSQSSPGVARVPAGAGISTTRVCHGQE
jgi:hypothetical protein